VLSALGWYHLVVFTVVVPALAIASRRAIRSHRPLPPRLKQFRASVVMLVLFGALSTLTAREQAIELLRLDLQRPIWSMVAGVGLLGAAIAIMRPRWRRAVLERRPAVHFFMPQTGAERVWWVLVSLLAGISEEITWRAVQTGLFATLTGSLVAGALLSAVAFGVAHAVQGWRSAAAIVAFALAFQGLYWLSGTLLVGMAVHAVYDLVAGLAYARLGRELGYELPAALPDEATA
jgi:membrane protease YdiL (CAAX protease family)